MITEANSPRPINHTTNPRFEKFLLANTKFMRGTEIIQSGLVRIRRKR